MRHEQQLRNFQKVLDAYTGDLPLAKFLPGYYRQNRQMGSSDRRTATDLLYKYYRLGRTCMQLPDPERLFIADFLCSQQASSFLAHFKPDYNDRADLPIIEKIDFLRQLGIEIQVSEIFPFAAHLSEAIDSERFLTSFFQQPDLFIRVHPGKEALVKQKLATAAIPFSTEHNGAIRLAGGTKLEEVFAGDHYFEVQDLSSQDTGRYFKPQQYDKWWDACAASGGKSLLLLAQQPEIKLVVSDIRESILNNLDERFANAGYRSYQKKEIDLTKNADFVLHDYEFDGIILDAPCTGSGTWGRSPEMISQFKEKTIFSFQLLQKSILPNVIKYLKPGKPIVYITCSVFREENEMIVDFMVKELGLKLESAEVLKGYERKADTMFVARLVKGK